MRRFCQTDGVYCERAGYPFRSWSFWPELSSSQFDKNWAWHVPVQTNIVNALRGKWVLVSTEEQDWHPVQRSKKNWTAMHFKWLNPIVNDKYSEPCKAAFTILDTWLHTMSSLVNLWFLCRFRLSKNVRWSILNITIRFTIRYGYSLF